MSAADDIVVTIHEVAYPGRAVARHDGQIVFLTGAWPGERVRARITRRHARHLEAELVEVLEPSPDRRSAACPLAERCPGCRYQTLDYAAEVACKAAQLGSLLARIGGLRDLPAIETRAAPAALGYRNKLVLHADAGDPPAALGYVAEDNASVFDVPACPLAHPALNTLLAARRADPDFRRALRPHARATFRHTAADGALAWIGPADPAAPPLTEATPMGPVRVPRGGFFQVNPTVAGRLLETVGAWARAIEAVELIVDAYAGAGVMGFAAARARSAAVRAIESEAAGLRAACANAAALGIADYTARAATTEAALGGALADAPLARTLLIVDPPRTGLAPAVTRAIARRPPAWLLYVSCAPDTLARDLRALAAGGYRPERLALHDMFPRTPYFETAVWLARAPG